MNIGFIGKGKTTKAAGVILNVRVRTSDRGRFIIITLSDPDNVSEIAFYNNEIVEEKRDLFVSGMFVIIELESSEYTTRLIGKDIFKFEERVVAAVKGLTLTIDYTHSKEVASKLDSLLTKGGRVQVLLKLILQHHKLSVLLPGTYVINFETICAIYNLAWIKDIEINTNDLII